MDRLAKTLTEPFHCSKNGWGWLSLGTIYEAELPSYSQFQRYGSRSTCDFADKRRQCTDTPPLVTDQS
jgi:hypothetical protein